MRRRMRLTLFPGQPRRWPGPKRAHPACRSRAASGRTDRFGCGAQVGGPYARNLLELLRRISVDQVRQVIVFRSAWADLHGGRRSSSRLHRTMAVLDMAGRPSGCTRRSGTSELAQGRSPRIGLGHGRHLPTCLRTRGGVVRCWSPDIHNFCGELAFAEVAN